MLFALDKVRETGTTISKMKNSGQSKLFDEEEIGADLSDTFPQVEEFEKTQKLGMEKDLLGFYLTDHPHADKLESMSRFVTCRISQLYSDDYNNQRVTVGGIVESVRNVTTKAGNQQMCFAKISDLGKAIEVVVFPKVYSLNPECWKSDNILLVNGRIESKQEDEETEAVITLIADSAQFYTGDNFQNTVQSKINKPKSIFIPKGLSQSKLVSLNTLLSTHKGKTPAELVFDTKTIPLPYGLSWNDDLVKEIDLLLK
jgi:DNA polymerase-3 subunit alpha